MVSPERTLGHIRTKLAQGRNGFAPPPYQPPALLDLVQRIEQALGARC